MIGHSDECYLVITPEDKVYQCKGNWPDTLISHLLTKYEKLVVVSLYSNTIKFVSAAKEYGETISNTYKEVHFAEPVTELN